MLESVVWQHLARHGNDATVSAGALHLSDTLVDGLREIPDNDLQAIVQCLQPTLGANEDDRAQPAVKAVPPADASSAAPQAAGSPPAPTGGAAAAERYRVLRPHARGALGKVS